VADVAQVIAKVRALGADIVLDGEAMKIVGAAHLSADQLAWLANNRAAIEQHLRQQAAPAGEQAAEETDLWGQYARVLYAQCPRGTDPCDWSWFVTTAGKIIRGGTPA